ncbi:MAG TPA: CCA tRNA nucleotidyltransferase [Firmicutes bacterium]|nr:CCA tRNA nucleotidyltransferase [Bacillota bacterium]
MFRRATHLKIPEPVLIICRVLSDHGYQAYIVGGAIRDALLGKTPADWDVTTDAMPDQVQQIFQKTLATGAKYGTITVVMENKFVDVTTMRQDAHYSDARHPDHVEFTTDLNTDLGRRDFTVNAIAYDPLTRTFHDPYQGLRDLRRKILRTVGDPKARFGEDALRMLRLIRFSAVLAFKPDKQTMQGIQPHLMARIARERIKEELSKLLLADAIVQPLQLLYTSGLMEQIIPELAQAAGVDQGSYHPWDVLGHSIMTCQAIKPELHLRLAALLHDVGKPQTISEDQKGIHFYGHDQLGAELAKEILKRLTYSKHIQTKVSLLIRHHMFQIHPHASDKAIRRLIHRVGVANIHDLIELRKADVLGMKHNPKHVLDYHQAMIERVNQIIEAENAFSLADLAISGTDLIRELNLQPGPIIGQILTALLDRVLDEPQLNNRSQLLSTANELIDTLSATDAES